MFQLQVNMVGPGRLLSRGRPRKPAHRRLNTISVLCLAEQQSIDAQWSADRLNSLQSGSRGTRSQDTGTAMEQDNPDDYEPYDSVFEAGSGADPWFDEGDQGNLGHSSLNLYLRSSRYKKTQIIEQEIWASILPAIYSEYMRCAQFTSGWGHPTTWNHDWKPACDCPKRKHNVDVVDFVGESVFRYSFDPSLHID